MTPIARNYLDSAGADLDEAVKILASDWLQRWRVQLITALFTRPKPWFSS